MRDSKKAARRKRGQELFNDGPWLFLVGDEVQDRDEKDRDRLCEIDQAVQLRIAEDLGGLAQVVFYKCRVAGAVQQIERMSHNDWVMIYTDDATRGFKILGDLVNVSHGRQACADIEYLADSCFRD